MNRIFVLVALGLALILGVGALNAAQEARTPTGDVCASPVGSPEVGSPEATPVDVPLAPGVGPLVASPEATPEATPDVLVACATPGVGTPPAAAEVVDESTPV